MFYDEHRVWPRQEPLPPRPSPPSRRERVLTRMLLVYALFALLAPISLSGAADLIRFLIALF